MDLIVGRMRYGMMADCGWFVFICLDEDESGTVVIKACEAVDWRSVGG